MNLKSVTCQKVRGKRNTDIQTFEICQTHGTGRDVSFSPTIVIVRVYNWKRGRCLSLKLDAWGRKHQANASYFLCDQSVWMARVVTVYSPKTVALCLCLLSSVGCICKSKWKFWFFRDSFTVSSRSTPLPGHTEYFIAMMSCRHYKPKQHSWPSTQEICTTLLLSSSWSILNLCDTFTCCYILVTYLWRHKGCR